MKKGMHIWMDGKILPEKQTRVSVLSHSLHYGSAVFEGIRCYDTEKGPTVFRLKDHMKRLVASAQVMGIQIPYSVNVLTQATLDIIKKNRLRNCYIRPIAFYGEHMGLNPGAAPVHVAIAAWDWGAYLDVDAARVTFAPLERIAPSAGFMHAKISGQYYNSVVATQDAKNRGFDEALLLDRDGYIAEGSGENIFLVRGKTMYTPQSGNLLPGITRDTLFDLAVREGYRVCESHITPKQLARFSEAFFVGTAAEVTPIDSIDTYLFNTGVDAPVTEHIKRRYHELIRGQIRGYSKWLTRVNN